MKSDGSKWSQVCPKVRMKLVFRTFIVRKVGQIFVKFGGSVLEKAFYYPPSPPSQKVCKSVQNAKNTKKTKKNYTARRTCRVYGPSNL